MFGLLNMPEVQEFIKNEIVKELKNKLDTDLGIASISIQPFNVIQLNDVYLNTRQGDTILNAHRIYADIDLMSLLDKRLIFSAARLNDFEVSLSKDSANAPLNIQFVIDAFKPKEDSNKEKIQVQVNTLNISNGRFNFDIKDKPYKFKDEFDANHIKVSDIESKISLKSLNTDSLNIQIKKLSLREKSGLKIKNLIVRIITAHNNIQVKGFQLDLPQSHIELEKCEINLNKSLSNADFIKDALFDTKISSSYISPKDISPLVPKFKDFKDRILLKSQITGKIDSINVSNITLEYGDKMVLQAQGQVKNVLDIDNLYLKGGVDHLSFTQNGLIGLLNNLMENKIDPQKEFINIQSVLFRGTIAGYLKGLKADGHIKTELGNVDANISMGFTPKNNITAFYKGNISTPNIELGKLLNNKDLGNTSFDLDIDLIKKKQSKMSGAVKGKVHKFDFKNYTYKDIVIDGSYDGLKVEGLLDLKDENGSLNVEGLFDLSKKEPELNFRAKVKNVRLDNLNLSQKYKESYLTLAVDANFTGKNIDDLQGYVDIDSISFLQSGKKFTMDKLRVEASGYKNERQLNITSDILNGHVLGTYSFSTIVNSIKRSLNPYLPVFINYTDNKRNKILENNLSFDFTVNNTENLTDVFKLPVTLYSQAKIIGFYNNINERFSVETFIPSANIAGSKFESGYLKAANDEQQIKSIIKGTFVTKNNTRNNLSVDIAASNDSIHLSTSFLGDNQDKLKGTLSNSVIFSKDPKTKELITDILIDEGQMVLNSSTWNMSKSHIQIKPKNIMVDHYNIVNTKGDQQLAINGTYSTEKDNDKQLLITLKNIDLDYVFSTLAISALEFEGFASGKLALSSIESKPYADINLSVKEFGFNKTKLGELTLNSQLDPQTNKVNLAGQIVNKNNKATEISGDIDPITQELSIYFDSKEVDIAFLNKYASALFNDIKGTGVGNVHLFGNFSKVTVEGTAFIQNGELGINFLNTRYNFTDTIHLKQDLIYFNNLKLHDQKGNTAQLSGKVVHEYFSNFIYYVQLESKNFMLYNATPKTNPLFYGTVFGSGYGTVKGDEASVDIDMNLQTEKGTYVHMDFLDEVATEYSFITYKKKETTDSIPKYNVAINKPTESPEMNINMNFYIDATPDATVEMLMDPVGGDKIKGTGRGTLQFVWGTNKDPRLYGTYEIYNGSYNFTFQKILERKFTIQNGSTVQFRGDPFEANLDVTAKYRVVANLFDLDKNLVTTTGQTSVPVNCLLNLTGPLIHPYVKLDIELPSTDPEIARQIKNLISSEDMMNRQIAYLLILSKFYSPNYADTDHKTNDFASFASATLSTQLGNILSSIDDRWQVGTNIRTSDSNFSSTEVELLLSSRLLNDRILFNGNFGYRDNPLTQDALIGDVDVEVLLNKIGTWRLKAYNHYNEKFYYINNRSIQTQGVGIMYKKDFDDFRDLFRRSKKEKATVDTTALTRFEQNLKIDTIRNIKNDTIKKIKNDTIIINKPDSTLLSARSFIKMK